MKVFYIGEAIGPVEAFGTVFEPGKASEVDKAFEAKVKSNPYFGEKASAKAPTAPIVHSPSSASFEARLNTAGEYSIYRGQVELQDKLSQKDAEAFNGMPDEDKSAYVNDL